MVLGAAAVVDSDVTEWKAVQCLAETKGKETAVEAAERLVFQTAVICWLKIVATDYDADALLDVAKLTVAVE